MWQILVGAFVAMLLTLILHKPQERRWQVAPVFTDELRDE
jgi:hypothetical protein